MSERSGVVEALRRTEGAAAPAISRDDALILSLFAKNAGRTREALRRWHARDAADPFVSYALGLHDQAHGRFDAAVDDFLAAIESPGSDPDLKEAAALSLADLDDAAPSFGSAILERGRKLLGVGPRRAGAVLGPAAAALLGEQVATLARRQGNESLADEVRARMGCAAAALVAGPFGPRELLGFDRTFAPEQPASWPAVFDLGPGRGEQLVRVVEGRDCMLHLGGRLDQSGTFYAASQIDLPAPAELVFRVETPNAFRLRVDDRDLLVHDTRVRLGPRVAFARAHLSAGRHRVIVKLSTRHANPVLLLGALYPDGSAADVRWRPSAEATGAPPPRVAAANGPERGAGTNDRGFHPRRPSAAGDPGRLRTLVQAMRSFGRGDVTSARATLVGLRAQTGSGAPAPLLDVLLGLATGADPSVAEEVARDASRALFRRAVDADPDLFVARLGLGRLAAGDNQIPQAIDILREAEARHPNVVEFGLLASELYANRGWLAEALAAADRARAANPEACRPLRQLLALRRRLGDAVAAGELAIRLSRCDRQSDAVVGDAMEGRRWSQALVEIGRLSARDPENTVWLNGRIDVARGRTDLPGTVRGLEDLARIVPNHVATVREQADALAATGDAARARDLLHRRMALAPGGFADLGRVAALVGRRRELERYRLDGRRVISEFRAHGGDYEASAILVLDYTAVRVFEDGSSLELTHNIIQVRSQEGIQRYGEFRPPEDAELLRVQTIKASDGRVLEPEEIEGKESLTLPHLAPGDFIEFEYLRPRDSQRGFEGGYCGERFYFQSFETPFDRSELTVIAPVEAPIRVDPRGPAPPAERTVTGALQVLHFLVRHSWPLRAEPRAVGAREYLPSVDVGWNCDWPSYVEVLRDALMDRDVAVPPAILDSAIPAFRRGSRHDRAHRIYRWVIDNVNDGNDTFALAPHILSARSGNRARLLAWLLRQADVPATIALVRDVSEDHTPTEMASAETYHALLVRIETEPGVRWVWTANRGAPFGYVPAALRGEEALVLRPGSFRDRVPPSAEDADARRVQVEVQLEPNGAAALVVRETYRGAGAVGWRDILDQVPAAELRRRFEQDYAGRLVEGAAVDELGVDGADDPERDLTIAYRMHADDLARVEPGPDGPRLVLPGLYLSLLGQNFARQAERRTTLAIGEATHVTVELRVRPPAGFRVASVPAPASLTFEPGSTPDGLRPLTTPGSTPGRFRLSAQALDGGVRIERTVVVGAGRVAPAAYPEFARFCRDVDAAEASEIVFVRAATGR